MSGVMNNNYNIIIPKTLHLYKNIHVAISISSFVQIMKSNFLNRFKRRTQDANSFNKLLWGEKLSTSRMSVYSKTECNTSNSSSCEMSTWLNISVICWQFYNNDSSSSSVSKWWAKQTDRPEFGAVGELRHSVRQLSAVNINRPHVAFSWWTEEKTSIWSSRDVHSWTLTSQSDEFGLAVARRTAFVMMS